MTTSATKTIDNLGMQPYIKYEEDRRFFDAKLLDDSRRVADQLSMDVSEPILFSEYQILFDTGRKETLWGFIAPPMKFNEQTKRLFVYQLAPKLGPEDFIETLIGRLEGKRAQEREERESKEQKKKLQWQGEDSFAEIDQECTKIIQLMQDINVLNKIMQHINAERYRYNKG